MFRYLLEGVAVRPQSWCISCQPSWADRRATKRLIVALLNALFGWTVVCWIRKRFTGRFTR